MRILLNVCIAVLVSNVALLVGFHSWGSATDTSSTAQSLGKLISAYSEPSRNPQFLVTSEMQCRYWGEIYCPRATARRATASMGYPVGLPLPEELQQGQLYVAFSATRQALNAATTDYIAFLGTNPGNETYVEKSREYEEQAGVLVGQLVSYLYDMQGQLIRKQTVAADRVLLVQYLCLLSLLFIVCLLRFRRGGRYGQL